MAIIVTSVNPMPGSSRMVNYRTSMAWRTCFFLSLAQTVANILCSVSDAAYARLVSVIWYWGGITLWFMNNNRRLVLAHVDASLERITFTGNYYLCSNLLPTLP
jgi:hypothetical protein